MNALQELLTTLHFLNANPELIPSVVLKSGKVTRQILEVVLNLAEGGIFLSEGEKRFFRALRQRYLINELLLVGRGVGGGLKKKQKLLASHRKFVKKIAFLGLKHFDQHVPGV